MPYKSIHMATFILLAVGGLNWLAVGLGYNLVEMILGKESVLSHFVYILVGLSAIYEIGTHTWNCRTCVEEKKKK